MRIKTKLTLGVGLLFLLILLLSIVGVKYTYELKQDTKNILEANYKTLEYSRNMLASLEEGSEKAMEKFEINLRHQESNISEIGEKEVTEEIKINFNSLIIGDIDSTKRGLIRKDIYTLMDLNMQAIQRKSEVAKTTADKAVFWISITGVLCFIIAFILLINLPSNIANPIRELTESIKKIASKKYSERVHFGSNSEFGQLAKSFNTMAEKLEEYDNSNLAKLMMEKKRIETLINNMHDPVLGLDQKLNVIFVNEEAIKIIGLPQAQIIGVNTHELAVKNDLVRTLIRDLMSGEHEANKQTPIKIYADNKEGYFEKETLHISITPTGEETKLLIGHVIILRNITQYKELDFAKTNFIATVSHEFKTPISSIKMSLQLLEKDEIGPLNEEQRNLIESIKDDASRLLKITGELLNMTQIDSGNIQLTILPCDPKKILYTAIHAAQTQADQKLIKFEVSSPDVISDVMADSDKTSWVLTNLISNAIRYSHENTIIYLSISQINDKIQFSVRDTGQGIAPQYKEKIFDRYFKVPGTKKGGTGLGLAISKDFIEAQNGEINVESEFGSGSIFTVTLSSYQIDK